MLTTFLWLALAANAAVAVLNSVLLGKYPRHHPARAGFCLGAALVLTITLASTLARG